MPECYNRHIVPVSPDARKYAMRMTTREFRDDAAAERHLIRHLRRMLAHCFYQDSVPLEDLTDQRVADEFAHNERYRRDLDLQGINPDTLYAFTDEGRTMVSAIINGWVRTQRMPPDEIER
jgi:hypothetical protein